MSDRSQEGTVLRVIYLPQCLVSIRGLGVEQLQSIVIGRKYCERSEKERGTDKEVLT